MTAQTIDRIQAAKAVDMMGLVGKFTSLRKVAAHEYAGPCPRCGGKDRFRVDPDKGWFCRRCTGEPGSGGHWGDQIDFVMWLRNVKLPEALVHLTGSRGFTKAELDKLAEERRQHDLTREREDHEKAQKAREYLNTSDDHHKYAAHPKAITEWGKRGVHPDWVAYFGLGYCEEREFTTGDTRFVSDSLTIPYFRYDHQNEKYHIVDLKHRLLKPFADGDKYRHHVPGCGNNLFYADLLMRKPIGDILIVEGEIKAIITWQACWTDTTCNKPNLTVISVPGKSYKPEWVDLLKGESVERVFVCLDPDAYKEAKRLADEIGNAVPLNLPAKIDDLILAGALDCWKLYDLLDNAWKEKYG